MKRKAYLLVFLLPAYLLLSYSSGAPFGYSGSPGDSNRTCDQCHSYSGSGYNPDFTVTGIPAAGYVPGQSYQITLTVNNANSAKKGFEACVEDNAGQKQGSFASTDSNTQPIQSNTYITHTSAGTSQSSWTFDWTAPATAQNDLTLYFAVNMANGDGNSTGDYIENSQISIPLNNTGSINNIDSNLIKIYPNPVTDLIQIQSGNYQFDRAQVQDILGKTYPVTLKNNRIDVSFLPSGTYFLKLENKKVSTVKQFIKK